MIRDAVLASADSAAAALPIFFGLIFEGVPASPAKAATKIGLRTARGRSRPLPTSDSPGSRAARWQWWVFGSGRQWAKGKRSPKPRESIIRRRGFPRAAP
jgi:hypothetical protein